MLVLNSTGRCMQHMAVHDVLTPDGALFAYSSCSAPTDHQWVEFKSAACLRPSWGRDINMHTSDNSFIGKQSAHISPFHMKAWTISAVSSVRKIDLNYSKAICTKHNYRVYIDSNISHLTHYNYIGGLGLLCDMPASSCNRTKPRPTYIVAHVSSNTFARSTNLYGDHIRTYPSSYTVRNVSDICRHPLH
jgi:hypothetical protein